MSNYKYNCRVCGFKFQDPPWGEDDNTPDFTHCPCCGVMFGYGDALPSSAKRWRERWLASGARWDAPNQKPENWNLEEQLKQIPPNYQGED